MRWLHHRRLKRQVVRHMRRKKGYLMRINTSKPLTEGDVELIKLWIANEREKQNAR